MSLSPSRLERLLDFLVPWSAVDLQKYWIFSLIPFNKETFWHKHFKIMRKSSPFWIVPGSVNRGWITFHFVQSILEFCVVLDEIEGYFGGDGEILVGRGDERFRTEVAAAIGDKAHLAASLKNKVLLKILFARI